MRIRVVIRPTPEAGIRAEPRFVDLEAGPHRVGSTAQAKIALQFPTISRNHGTIEVNDSGVRYIDHSRNGSLLGGSRIAPKSPIPWQASAELLIGPYCLRWIDPPRDEDDPEAIRQLTQRLAQTYLGLLARGAQGALPDLSEILPPHPKRDQIQELLRSELYGDGPLQPWLSHPQCREILINAHDQIFVDLGEGLTRSTTGFLLPETLLAWARRTAERSGRRLDSQNPICEATLPGGERFHAVLPPIAAGSLSVSIRRFGSAPMTTHEALRTRWLDPTSLAILESAIHSKKNIVISGGTGSGKTSLLNFLSQFFSLSERIITIEDVPELQVPVPNRVSLLARRANADGQGEISLRKLVQSALRMRPDRILVGECRGDEVLEMLQALNTGHPGSLTTVHANSCREAIERLELLALLGASNLSPASIERWIASTVQCLVQVERFSNGARVVTEIRERKQNAWETVYARACNEVVPASP